MRHKYNAPIAICYIARSAMEKFTMEKDLLSTIGRNTHKNYVLIENYCRELNGKNNGANNIN